MNVNLNAGGILGGLLGAGIAFAVIFSGDPGYERWMKRLVIGLVVVGAVGGNWLWALVVRRPRPQGGIPVGHGSADADNDRSCAICGVKLVALGKGTRLCDGCRQQTG
jgi:hypothetical protein